MTDRCSRPGRTGTARSAARDRLWDASPLTYVALVIALVLSVFPLYYMFVIATRTNDAINDVPPPCSPGGDVRRQLRSGCCDNEDANFVTGLVNSVIVSVTVTLSVVFFSSLAGFAFAKLRFRGRNGLLLADPRRR